VDGDISSDEIRRVDANSFDFIGRVTSNLGDGKARWREG